MTNFTELSGTFQNLLNLAPEAFMPIENEEDLVKAEAFLKAIDEEIGDNETHPLLPLAETLMQRIMTYEEKHFPLPPPAPDMHLRLLMKEHGSSQVQVSEGTGLDQGLISRLASGKRRFTADHARKLGKFFGVNPGEFL